MQLALHYCPNALLGLRRCLCQGSLPSRALRHLGLGTVIPDMFPLVMQRTEHQSTPWAVRTVWLAPNATCRSISSSSFFPRPNVGSLARPASSVLSRILRRDTDKHKLSWRSTHTGIQINVWCISILYRWPPPPCTHALLLNLSYRKP